MEKTNDRIIELEGCAIELWHRCESWKKALLKIKQLTNDPMIIRHIDRELKGNTP